jgi:hypothetical protein
VRAEKLLVATGRRANLRDAGLETAGLDPGAVRGRRPVCDRAAARRLRGSDGARTRRKPVRHDRAPDFTTDDTYRERGINLLLAYLSERSVDAADYLIQIPDRLAFQLLGRGRDTIKVVPDVAASRVDQAVASRP